MRTRSHKSFIAGLAALALMSGAISCSRQEQPRPAQAQPPPAAAAPSPAPAATAAAPAPAPAPAASNIASSDGEKPGTRVEVTELKRTSGGTLSLKFSVINDSDKKFGFGYDFASPDNHVGDFDTVGGVTLLDPVGKKKYFVVRDSEKKCVCSSGLHDVGRGSRANLWAKFPAPPEDVKKISLVIPHFAPMDDVPISQ